MGYKTNRRDTNEETLVELWRQMGCVWIPKPRENGFDGVLCRCQRVWIVEIKDGGKPPSARQLTPNERKRKRELEDVGVRYNVIENEQQAIELLGKEDDLLDEEIEL